MHNITPQLSRDMLTSLVRRAVDRQTLAVSTWELQPIKYPNVSPSSRGLYRIRGTGHDRGAEHAWSLVLKVFALPPDGDANTVTYAWYWKREALAYQSGLLRKLPSTFTAPACYGVEEHPCGYLWLWLEDVPDASSAKWPLEQFALVARHLGHLAGPYLAGQPRPQEPWLTRGYSRTVVADAAPLMVACRHPDVWQHPLLQVFPPAVVQDVCELWDKAPHLLATLERLPQVLCHHDVWRRNLFTRIGVNGQEQTIAIDWEVVGLGAAGEDLGNLLYVSLLNFDVEVGDAPRLTAMMWQAYLEGLQECGWCGDPSVVEAAFALSVLRCIFSTVAWPVAIVHDVTGRSLAETEQRWQRNIADIFTHWSALAEFLLGQLHAARLLLSDNGFSSQRY